MTLTFGRDTQKNVCFSLMKICLLTVLYSVHIWLQC